VDGEACGEARFAFSPYPVARRARGAPELGDIVHFSKEGSETRVCRLPAVDLTPEEVRKIRREVMRTRGELLFASAVVLFEGETEEQALPIFARHHWSQHPFERGVAFVGGDGNYFPLLRIFGAIRMPWFIFSDGEPEAQASVSNALQKMALTLPQPNVFVLPNGTAIEEDLVHEGYQAELRSAAVNFQRPFHSPQHEQFKKTEVGGWSDGDLTRYLRTHKTGMAAHWAKAIIKVGGARSVPAAIKALLDAIDQLLTSPTQQNP
jgi:putative ATP-dependent endonuclease of OLD family